MPKRAKSADAFHLLIRLAKEGHVWLAPPASETAIRKLHTTAMKKLGAPIPAAYLELLRIANGLQNNGAFFKSAEELVPENLDLNHPEIIVLGDKGNLAWHVFDKRDERFHTVNFGFPDERFAWYDSLDELLIGVMKEQQVLD